MRLLDEQLLREKKMSDDGSARYLNRQEKHHNLSNADSHQQFIVEAVETVATALRNSIVQEQTKGRGRKHLWCTLLEDLGISRTLRTNSAASLAIRCRTSGMVKARPSSSESNFR